MDKIWHLFTDEYELNLLDFDIKCFIEDILNTFYLVLYGVGFDMK